MMGKRAINKWVLMANYLIAAILVRKVAVVFGVVGGDCGSAFLVLVWAGRTHTQFRNQRFVLLKSEV